MRLADSHSRENKVDLSVLLMKLCSNGNYVQQYVASNLVFPLSSFDVEQHTPGRIHSYNLPYVCHGALPLYYQPTHVLSIF